MTVGPTDDFNLELPFVKERPPLSRAAQWGCRLILLHFLRNRIEQRTETIPDLVRVPKLAQLMEALFREAANQGGRIMGPEVVEDGGGQLGVELLRRLDGTRDRVALMSELRRIEPDAMPEDLETSLSALAKLALLTA